MLRTKHFFLKWLWASYQHLPDGQIFSRHKRHGLAVTFNGLVHTHHVAQLYTVFMYVGLDFVANVIGRLQLLRKLCVHTRNHCDWWRLAKNMPWWKAFHKYSLFKGRSSQNYLYHLCLTNHAHCNSLKIIQDHNEYDTMSRHVLLGLTLVISTSICFHVFCKRLYLFWAPFGPVNLSKWVHLRSTTGIPDTGEYSIGDFSACLEIQYPC